MTGRYYLIVPLYPARNVTFERPWQTKAIEGRYQEQLKGCWHRFHALCRSLHSDGLQYSVEFNLIADEPHVLITASGKAKPARRPKAQPLTLPQPVSLKRCRQEIDAREFYLPEHHDKRGCRSPKIGNTYAYHLVNVAEEHLRAEIEYWRELELLSGQREHFKPGLADEIACADDEVAA